MTEKKETKVITRREFIKDASIVLGGTAVSSAFFLSACGKEVEVTKTVTTTGPGTTSTVTTTAGGSAQTVTKYTCPVCSQEFNSLNMLKDHYEAEHEEQITAENTINITVNGGQYQLQVKDEETLQDLLRNQLGLTSVKEMCLGEGACGSCTVIMNGKAILSCMTLASWCDGATIETAEFLGITKHPLVERYVANSCSQCGYCTPGLIVTIKALLEKNNNPTDDQILNEISGNLCRCGTYPQHVIAAKEAASIIREVTQ